MKKKSKHKFSWNKKLLFFMILFSAIMIFQAGCATTGGYDSRSSSDRSYSDESYRDEGNYADEEAVLDEYGEWIIVPHYGTVWRPFVSDNWQPYYYGNWMRTENGWTWLSYEPFGWIVYHYGYWDYTPQTGWFWIESNDWSPARVEWQSYGDYIGWAPMAPPGAYFEQTREARAYRWTFVDARNFTQENIGRYRLRNSPSLTNPTAPPDIRTVETYQNHQVRIVKTSRARRTVDGRQFDRMIVPERENATINRYEPHILGDVVRRRNDPRTIDRRNNTFNGNSPTTPVTPSGTNSSPTRQSNTTVSPRTNTGNTNTSNPSNGSTNGTRNNSGIRNGDGNRGRASEPQDNNKPNSGNNQSNDNNQSKDNNQSRGSRSRTRNNGANTPSSGSGSNVPANPNSGNQQPPASGQGNTRQGRATDERNSKAAPTKTRNSEENKKSGNDDNSNSRDNGSREEKRDGSDRSR